MVNNDLWRMVEDVVFMLQTRWWFVLMIVTSVTGIEVTFAR